MQRLGVILPASNTTVEYKFSKTIVGTDVSVHYAHVPLKDMTAQDLERMECELEGEVLSALESELGVSIISNNSATLWA